MFNDPVLIGGVIAGLAMGSFGYVLFRFAWRPARRYRRLKSQIRGIVGADRRDGLDEAGRNRLRHLAVELHALTSGELPHWFRLALERRGENPEEAVRQIQRLVNCHDREALQGRCAAVRRALGIGTATAEHRH